MIIFSPGPANISQRVRSALLKPDICHRDSEFSLLLKETQGLILQLCGAGKGYEAVIFTGSGTAAIEAVLASLKGMGRRLLVISNGIYGRRAYDIALMHGLKTKQIISSDNLLPDLKRIEEEILKFHPRLIYVVHHETTSGLLNPLGQIAVLAKRYRCLFIVDAISSVAGEEIRLRQWGIDALIGSANKCIRGVSGLSFAVLSRRFIRCLSDRQKAPFYLNLYEHLVMERTGQTPFTPAVHCFYALREALRELKQQGLRRRISRYKEIASLLRGGLRRMGLKVYLPDRLSANTMTTVILPKAISYGWLHRQCKRRGYCIYSAVGRLKGRAFRLGTVGCISKSDIRGFLKALARIVNQRGRQT